MKEIAPHVFQISLGTVNAFVIEDKGLTLIDTGYPGAADRIFRAISRAGKDPRQIKQVLLTHGHRGHAGSAGAISKKLGIPVYAHVAEVPLMERGIAGRYPLYRSAGFFNWLVYHLCIRNRPGKIEPVLIEERLADGDVLPVLGGLRVIHTPGHSRGHISLYVKSQNVLIAGDICGNVFGLGPSCVYEDRELGMKSISKIQQMDFSKAVFGHGRPLLYHAAEKFREKFPETSLLPS